MVCLCGGGFPDIRDMGRDFVSGLFRYPLQGVSYRLRSLINGFHRSQEELFGIV